MMNIKRVRAIYSVQRYEKCQKVLFEAERVIRCHDNQIFTKANLPDLTDKK